MAKTAVATKPAPAKSLVKATDTALPDWMKKDAGRGTENVDSEDMQVPRLKLMQGLSPELDQYNKLRPGMYFHDLAEHIFDAPFRGVVIYYDKRFLLWNPRDNGGGILARADDGIHWQPAHGKFEVKLDKKDGGARVTWETAETVKASGLAEWGTMNPDDSNSPPAATRMLNFVVAFPDFPDIIPAVLTFQRASIGHGRRLLGKLKAGRAPIFGRVFEISAGDATNKSGNSFKVPALTGVGLVEDKDMYEGYRTLHENFSKSGLQIRDEESLRDDAVAESDAEDADDEPEAKGGAKRPKY